MRPGKKAKILDLLARETNDRFGGINGKVPAIAGDVPIKRIELFEESDLPLSRIGNGIDVNTEIEENLSIPDSNSPAIGDVL